MKRTAIALTLIMALLFSAVAGTLVVNLTKANPMPMAWLPTEPVTTPPIIALQSPSQNQSYNSTDIWLNFTVSKPQTWFSQTELSESYMPGTYMLVGKLISYHYVLDGNESQNISVEDDFRWIDPPEKPEETLSFSINLTLTKGSHNITVVVESESTYVIEEYRFSDSPKTITIIGASEPIFFNVVEPSELIPEPFPTIPIVATLIASAAVVGGSLLVYIKKRKH